MTREQISSFPNICRFLKWNFKQRLGFKSIRTKTPFGAVMDLDYVDQSATHIFFRHYETEEAETLSRLLTPGMTVLDIGANIGYFTLLMAKRVTAKGHVYAFEPNPRMIIQLQRNLSLNKDLMDGRVQLEKIALGSSNTEMDFYSPVKGAEGVGGLKNTNRAPLDQTFQVQVSMLDNWLALKNIGSVHLLKMDVEGGELDVLRGAVNVLKVMRPILLFEAVEVNTAPYDYSVKDILDFIRQFDYVIQPMQCGYNYLAIPRTKYENNL